MRPCCAKFNDLLCFSAQKAAGVSEEDSLEEEHGQELGGMDEPKNLRTVALRALARAEHENYIKPLPMYENE